jgi:beta-glucosidase
VEVVQVYIADLVTSATWVEQELKGFARVSIKGGETLSVNIVIKVADCSIVNANGERVVEPGDFEARVGKEASNVAFSLPFTIQ